MPIKFMEEDKKVHWFESTVLPKRKSCYMTFIAMIRIIRGENSG